MAQQRFVLWSGNNLQQVGPSHAPVASRVIPGAINREKIIRPGPLVSSPYEPLPPTNEMPKKQTGKSKNKVSTANIPPFDLENDVDDADGDPVILWSNYTGECISFYNVDPTKVRRNNYEPIASFLQNLVPLFLDCDILGNRCETQF